MEKLLRSADAPLEGKNKRKSFLAPLFAPLQGEKAIKKPFFAPLLAPLQGGKKKLYSPVQTTGTRGISMSL